MALTKVTKGVIKSDIDYEVKDISASGNVNISGVITASSFSGPSSGTDGNFSGIVTASKFVGDGSELTGVSGFGTALSNTAGDLLNLVYKTPRDFVMSGVTSVYLNSDTTSGGMLFTRLGGITVGGASTLHIGIGTTLAMDVLKLF